MSDQTLSNNAKGGVLITLGEDASTELALVGGKGASIGRLVKAGLPVPAGFVISTDAYAECTVQQLQRPTFGTKFTLACHKACRKKHARTRATKDVRRAVPAEQTQEP